MNKEILNHYILTELINNLFYANPNLLNIIIKGLSINKHSTNDIDSVKFYCEKSLSNTINVLKIIDNQ